MPLTASGCLDTTVVESVCGSVNAGDPSGLDHVLKHGKHLLCMLVGTLNQTLPTDRRSLPWVSPVTQH